MFIDKVRINLKSGKGGDGAVYFGENGRPSGGDGGDGGSVILEGTTNIYDLRSFKNEMRYTAESGKRGGSEGKQGKNGPDLIIRVPIVTEVYDLYGNFILAITEPGQQKILLQGGHGGLGNYYFRRGQINTLHKFTPGTASGEIKAFLELKLVADIVFIGFPNAGKSSMLNELTNADVKVASYAFTTISPHLGRLDDITLMDLPGLIEGASTGKGLGTKFTKHTEYARLVAHFISLESEDIVNDYQAIRRELVEISPNLAEKPEMIILTKSDLVSADEVKRKVKLLKKYSSDIVVTSAYDFDALENLKKVFRELLDK